MLGMIDKCRSTGRHREGRTWQMINRQRAGRSLMLLPHSNLVPRFSMFLDFEDNP